MRYPVLWLNPFYYPIVNNWQKWAEFVRIYQVGLGKYILDPEKHQNVMLKKTSKKEIEFKYTQKEKFLIFHYIKGLLLNVRSKTRIVFVYLFGYFRPKRKNLSKQIWTGQSMGFYNVQKQWTNKMTGVSFVCKIWLLAGL